MTPLKTIVISTKDGCPTLLANDGYFGQACILFHFYSCLFCKFKLIKGANKVVVVVVVVVRKKPWGRGCAHIIAQDTISGVTAKSKEIIRL